MSDFFIDSTTLGYIQTCPRSAAYYKLLKRESAGVQPALHAGKVLHEALEYRYKHCAGNEVTTDVMGAQARLIERGYEGIDWPQDDYRTCARIKDVVAGYNEHWPREHFEVLAVEAPFAVPLGTIRGRRCYYIGRIDLVVRYQEQVWILDHKTTSIWSRSYIEEFRNSSQQIGYCYAYASMGRPMPQGSILNAILIKKRSERPRPGTQFTSYHREQFHYPPERIEEWLDNTTACVETFLRYCEHYDEPTMFPYHDKWCITKYMRPCPYLDVCKLPQQQRRMMLGSGEYQDVTWSPLAKDERDRLIEVIDRNE
jgi:hypothetical protein